MKPATQSPPAAEVSIGDDAEEDNDESNDSRQAQADDVLGGNGKHLPFHPAQLSSPHELTPTVAPVTRTHKYTS